MSSEGGDSKEEEEEVRSSAGRSLPVRSLGFVLRKEEEEESGDSARCFYSLPFSLGRVGKENSSSFIIIHDHSRSLTTPFPLLFSSSIGGVPSSVEGESHPPPSPRSSNRTSDSSTLRGALHIHIYTDIRCCVSSPLSSSFLLLLSTSQKV